MDLGACCASLRGTMEQRRKKKEVDMQALQSEFKRIPNLDILTARDLLDIGMRHVHELNGRSPEVLFEQVRLLRPQTPPDRLASIRMAVYYAETPEPDPALMQPHRWV